MNATLGVFAGIVTSLFVGEVGMIHEIIHQVIERGLLDSIKQWADWCIQSGGLFGAGFLMALESMIFPVPSEVVMPPLGMAVYRGEHVWYWAIVATSFGSLIGSVVSYYLGYFGGRPLVMKVGKWLLLNEAHLNLTHQWFDRWGSLTVFVCRFVPVVRHFISIPAGIARMNVLKFCLYTVIGATLWNGFLLWLGYYLQSRWETILVYRKPIDITMVALLILAVIAWYGLNWRKPRT